MTSRMRSSCSGVSFFDGAVFDERTGAEFFDGRRPDPAVRVEHFFPEREHDVRCDGLAAFVFDDGVAARAVDDVVLIVADALFLPIRIEIRDELVFHIVKRGAVEAAIKDHEHLVEVRRIEFFFRAIVVLFMSLKKMNRLTDIDFFERVPR